MKDQERGTVAMGDSTFEAPQNFYVRWALGDDGSLRIRKWSQFPFDGATEYAAPQPTHGTSATDPAPAPNVVWDDAGIAQAEALFSEMNIRAASDLLPCSICGLDAETLGSKPRARGILERFEAAYPELYWHIAKGKICAGEPLYGAIITTIGTTEIGHGESDVSADEAFRIAIEDAGLSFSASDGDLS